VGVAVSNLLNHTGDAGGESTSMTSREWEEVGELGGRRRGEEEEGRENSCERREM